MAIGAMDQLYVDQMKNNVETIMEHIEEMLPEQVFSLPDYSTWIRDHETDEAIFYKMPYSIEILNDGDGYTIIDIEAQGEDFKFTKATFGNMIILNSHNKDKNRHTLGTPHQHIATLVYCM